VPRGELRQEIDVVLEFAVLEERALHPADESLDGALLVSAARRAHLDADAEVDDRLREGGVALCTPPTGYTSGGSDPNIH
jgi:hypothetical protein